MAAASPYTFEFHVLDDDETLNAFALPGGQVFVTHAMVTRLETDDLLAGVLGHEIAEAGYDPGSRSRRSPVEEYRLPR